MTGRLLVLALQPLFSRPSTPFTLLFPPPPSPSRSPVPSPPAPSPLSALQPGTLEPSSPVPFPPRSPFPSPPPSFPQPGSSGSGSLKQSGLSPISAATLPPASSSPHPHFSFPPLPLSLFPSPPPPHSPLPLHSPLPPPPPLPSSLPPPLPLPPTPPFPAWQLWSRASTWAFMGGKVHPPPSLPSPHLPPLPPLPQSLLPIPPHSSPTPLPPLSPLPHPLPHPLARLFPVWQLWSRASTWAFMGGKVPGIGASVGANVTIPCGRAVLLDVPRVSLGLLVVKGWLRLLDNPFVPSISVQARFIIVYGRLSVGTEKHHFSSQATFTLVPNLRFGRSEFLLRQPAPADPAHPRSLGHKAFVVVGGQVDFHGMPGGASTLAWVRLARRANKGARQITVDADVSAWPRGGVIAVASTTPDLNNAEKAIITGVRRVGPSTSVISLYRHLKHLHSWERHTVRDGFGVVRPFSYFSTMHFSYFILPLPVPLTVRRVGPSSSIISLYRPLKHSHDGKRHAVRDGFGVVRPSTVRRVGPSSTCKCWDGERHFSYFLLPLPVPLTVRRVGPSSSIISLYRPLKHSHDGERNAVRDGSIISLYRPLKHSHDGEKNAVRDGFGGTVDVRAEVALLTRNIVIQGVHEQPPYQYDGGHFMVYMTRTPQTIHGVQFKGLGMQGSLGNDALWYSTQKGALLTALSHSAFESTQKGALLTALSYSHPLAYRCIVVHATSRVTIADNVAYETRGHCFVLEEGSEARNTFIRNLGMSTRAVHQLIPPASLAKLDRQTDDKPSTFWLATPFNSFVGNVAAGSEDSGFWMELNKHMRGLSKNLPYWKKLSPMTLAFGVFTANVLHSNALFGLRTYPHGARPMFPSRGKGRESIQVRISHSLIYSNPIGVFLYNSQSITDGHSTFVNTHIPFLSYFPRLPTTHHPPSPLPSVFLVFLYNSQSITVSHSTLVNTHIAINPEPQLSLHPSFPPTPPPSVFLYNSQSITVSQSTFLNNRVAIDLNRNFGILILACTFIGRTVCSSHSTFLNNRVAIDLNRNFGILILTCTFIGGTTCSKSSGGSTPYDAASTHLMPPTPPQLLPSTHALMPSTHAPTPLMPSTHAPTPLMPSTQATPQLPAGAASSSLHIEAATNEDEMEGYTTSNWQSPGLMLTAPQYSMEDDYNEDEYSETAEAATKGVMGRGGKWGWRKRRVRGESNGSTYKADEGDDEGVGESTAKILSTYLKDGSAYNEDQLVYNDDETAYNGSEDGHEVDEEEVEDEEEEEEDDGGGEIEAVQRVKEMATRGRVAAGFFYSRDGGTFKSPIGVMLSQVKLSGMLEANRVVNSR
ncbi:unnamed protein product [Closterium sp. NIES-65]|nr:unnamed protein product [Closterium sp. NIES-65]